MPLRQYAKRPPGHLDRNVFIRIIKYASDATEETI